MRKLVIAAAALSAAGLIAAAPAAAQPVDSRDYEEAIARVDLRRAAAMVERMVDAFMGLPVGGIAAAFDPLGRGGIYPTDTLGSITHRNDPDAHRRMRANIRGAARSAEVTGRAVARMMPVLERSLEEMRGAIAEAIDVASDD
jgi:hypothetical protein